MKSEFFHPPQLSYLNHGSFGATPKRLIAFQRKLQEELESHPVRFMSEIYPQAYKTALSPTAHFLGTSPDNIAFVTNATSGIATVLQSLRLQEGDELICTNHRYQAVYNSMAYQVRLRGARLIECAFDSIAPEGDSVRQAIENKISKRTRLIIIDAISSITAHAFELEPIIALAQDRNIPIFVDGAHSPGQHPVNLDQLGADFWTGNFHKWLSAPKGCAVLYASPKWHSTLHAPIPSHGFENGWQEELAWMGTFDPTAWLCAPESIRQWEDWGGWSFVKRNNEQQQWATERICHHIKGALASPTNQLSMRAIVLPIHAKYRDKLYKHLQNKFNTDTFLHAYQEKIILRISAYSAYTEDKDFERLIEGLLDFNHAV
ncbi:MAG: aminotransferase class V-fold PLP-dependent enzyme [Myxococcota bacterium]